MTASTTIGNSARDLLDSVLEQHLNKPVSVVCDVALTRNELTDPLTLPAAAVSPAGQLADLLRRSSSPGSGFSPRASTPPAQPTSSASRGPSARSALDRPEFSEGSVLPD